MFIFHSVFMEVKAVDSQINIKGISCAKGISGCATMDVSIFIKGYGSLC